MMKIDKDTVYICRGNGTRFDHSIFKEIKNEPGWPKPNGGLWSSPENSEWGWIDWCISEGYRNGPLEEFFRFKLKPGGKIYIIDSPEDLLSVPYKIGMRYESYSSLGRKLIDYEKMRKDYDAIFLSEEGEKETRYSHQGMSLYGWDCETLLVLNPDIIVEV